jgi:hypothetical protein
MAFKTPITVKEAISNIYAKKYLLPPIVSFRSNSTLTHTPKLLRAT